MELNEVITTVNDAVWGYVLIFTLEYVSESDGLFQKDATKKTSTRKGGWSLG